MFRRLMILFCLVTCLGNYEAAEITLKKYERKEVLPLMPLMCQWVAHFYGAYPYLYAPSSELIVNSSDTMFINEKESLVLSAAKDGELVGLAFGISLDSPYLYESYFPESLKDRFLEKGYNPHHIFYVNVFIISPEHLDDEALVSSMYNALAEFAKGVGKKEISYMEIIQNGNHPLKPESYLPPEPWGRGHLPDFESTGITIDIAWPTFQEDSSVKKETHSLVFYHADIQ